MSAEKPVPCPECGKPAEPDYVETDIEVGIMRHLSSVHCAKCGETSFCLGCGKSEGHTPWCYVEPSAEWKDKP